MLDEAQMVGAGLTSVALMAQRLSAEHRWCVTGTPIGGGQLEDVTGLMRSLRWVKGGG